VRRGSAALAVGRRKCPPTKLLGGDGLAPAVRYRVAGRQKDERGIDRVSLLRTFESLIPPIELDRWRLRCNREKADGGLAMVR
jgi:hypothetical protein